MSDENRIQIESEVSAREQVLEQQIQQLKKQQQLQHQILLQHFQAQQQQLAEQHEAQLRQHLKEFWEQQKQLEEEMREKEKLEALKTKEKHEQSAVASSEVKQKLQVFLMKKQREAASASPSIITGSTSYRNCYEIMNKHQQSPLNCSGNSQVYTFDPGVEGRKDFPLRKTASEPNLLKVRIKQRVMERRTSPMTKRHDRLLANIKKKSHQIANCTVTSNNSLGPLPTERCSPTATAPIKEEDEEFTPLRPNNLQTLFSSPSMPNISIQHHLLLPPPLPPVARYDRLQKALGRTQSSPLPLGPPLRVIEEIDLTGGEKQQRRDMMMREERPLSRTLSSPMVGHDNIPYKKIIGSLTTGLAFDNLMLKHTCICGNNSNHPEHAGRLQSIWARLCETGLVARCDRLRSRKATIEELQLCHTEVHSLLFGTNPLNRQKMVDISAQQLPIKSFVRLACGGIGVDSDTTWNEIHTPLAARMAVGCVADLARKTMAGDIKNGFAVVRPPGHHAEAAQAMGFCFFNSVAVAARLLQQRAAATKILIVDWDVHHGNGTQQIFYDDPSVLFISIHRHDDGNFFPGTGSPTECGIGAGLGFNVNIAWSGGLAPPLGDAEYLAAFRTIVIPIAKHFGPDIILVSAGFDASTGHSPPLGGYKVSPACFGHMTKELMHICDGKVVLALEGGYDLPAICDSAAECVRVLLGEEPAPIAPGELQKPPCQNAIDTLQKTIAIQHPHWPIIKHSVAILSCPAALSGNKNDESETVSAMASLSMKQTNNLHSTTTHQLGNICCGEPMENN